VIGREVVLRFAALLVSLWCTTDFVAAQAEQAPVFQSGVNLVLAPVVVRSKQGQTISGLTKDDFQLFDKGKRQVIVSFSAVTHSGDTAQSQPASKAQPGNVANEPTGRTDTFLEEV
jgi:hypothetical protein